ncbi:MAG: metallophosphoesterase, partial [Prevotella sp.]|nr:metallophosphoesterase [Prevotella sp.]
MIARAPYLFLLLILIPDVYLDLHYWRHRFGGWTTKRILYWMPTIGMIAYTLRLMYEKNFIPDNPTILYIYLLLLGLIVIPKWIFMLCSITGLGFCRLFRKKKNYGNLIGLCMVPLLWFVLIYGSTIGFEKLEVNQQTYTSPDLPAAFDGYRIVLFSDAHVGSYKGRQHILQNAIDHINAQHPDLIVYTGDLQNTQPQDIYEHMDLLSSLKAKDGVYSVLGNHDYAMYIDADEARKVANNREVVSLEKQMGWTLLRNEHRILTKGKDHIVLAGMENDGDGKKFPQLGNINKTLKGVKKDDFILLLEHDPSSWRRKI